MAEKNNGPRLPYARRRICGNRCHEGRVLPDHIEQRSRKLLRSVYGVSASPIASDSPSDLTGNMRIINGIRVLGSL